MALTLGDNFSYQGAKPLDARLKYDTVAAMAAMADSILYDGCLAYCVATAKTYQWISTNTVDPTTGRWREFETGGGQVIQYDSLPTASASNVGQIVQYTGATGGNLTNGFFYKCTSDGEQTPTYSWIEIETSTVDSTLDSASENPVQNKVVKTALDSKATPSDISSAILGIGGVMRILYNNLTADPQTATYVTTTEVQIPVIANISGNRIFFACFGSGSNGGVAYFGEIYAAQASSSEVIFSIPHRYAKTFYYGGHQFWVALSLDYSILLMKSDTTEQNSTTRIREVRYIDFKERNDA